MHPRAGVRRPIRCEHFLDDARVGRRVNRRCRAHRVLEQARNQRQPKLDHSEPAELVVVGSARLFEPDASADIGERGAVGGASRADFGRRSPRVCPAVRHLCLPDSRLYPWRRSLREGQLHDPGGHDGRR